MKRLPFVLRTDCGRANLPALRGRAGRRSHRVLLFLLSCLCAYLAGRALAEGSGTAAADFLKVNPDCRSAALGNSGVTDFGSGFAAYHNPALLSRSEHRFRLAGAQTQWLLGVQGVHYALSLALPASRGSWGAGVFVSDWRTDPFDALDPYGRPAGQVGYQAQNMGLGLAHEVAPSLHVGGTVKRVTQAFTETGGAGPDAKTASAALAWDAGLVYDLPVGGLRAGAAAQNIGNKVSFGLDQAPLPQIFRLGLEGPVIPKTLRWGLEASAEPGRKITGKFGVAYSPFGLLSLRAGLDTLHARQSLYGLTSGIGFQWPHLAVDYALVPQGYLGVTQRISLSWRFGSLAHRESAQDRVRVSDPLDKYPELKKLLQQARKR